jgi:hypothetical protein
MPREQRQEWQEKAESYRLRAAFYRTLIEQAERAGGRGGYPRWAETKAILLQMAEEFERGAAIADACGAGAIWPNFA